MYLGSLAFSVIALISHEDIHQGWSTEVNPLGWWKHRDIDGDTYPRTMPLDKWQQLELLSVSPMVPQQQHEQIRKSRQWHWSCSPLWAVETLVLTDIFLCCPVALCLCLSPLFLFWQKTMSAVLATKWPHLKCDDQRIFERVIVFVCVRKKGRRWEWEIPFRPPGLVELAVCGRKISFSVYSSVVPPLYHTHAAPLFSPHLFSYYEY